MTLWVAYITCQESHDVGMLWTSSEIFPIESVIRNVYRMKPIIVLMPKWTPFRPLERCFNKAIFYWTFLKLSHPKSFCSAFVGQGTDNRSRELLSKLHCFEPLSGTASKHFVCQDIGLSYIFKLIVSTSEEIICYIKVLVLGQVKQENSKVSDCRPWLKNFACLSSLIPRKEFFAPLS